MKKKKKRSRLENNTLVDAASAASESQKGATYAYQGRYR